MVYGFWQGVFYNSHWFQIRRSCQKLSFQSIQTLTTKINYFNRIWFSQLQNSKWKFKFSTEITQSWHCGNVTLGDLTRLEGTKTTPFYNFVDLGLFLLEWTSSEIVEVWTSKNTVNLVELFTEQTLEIESACLPQKEWFM